MTNVTVCKKHRVEFCGARPCDICIMQAKCLEVERLRKALEAAGSYIGTLKDNVCGHPESVSGLCPLCRVSALVREALTLTPAAGNPEEADETGAARKDKESD